jgi:hypothetical protein
MDSDLALDVRAEFRERVANGQSAEAAARSLVRDWGTGFEDREDGATMWLALADAAWETGSLPASVKKKALALAGDPATIEPFALGGLGAARRAALAKLVAKLGKKPPAPKRILRRKKRETELTVGDLVVYTLPTGHKALLWGVVILIDKGGATPELELLDFVGKRVPTAKELRRRALPARLTKVAYVPWGRLPARFYVFDLAQKNDPGQRYYVWPEKYAPKRKIAERGMGPFTRLGPELEGQIMDELGVRAKRA